LITKAIVVIPKKHQNDTNLNGNKKTVMICEYLLTDNKEKLLYLQ